MKPFFFQKYDSKNRTFFLVEWQFRAQDLMPRIAEHERALLRSQSGPAAGDGFCSCAFQSSGQDRFSALSGAFAPALASPIAPNFAHMPMWPSSWLFWPSSCIVVRRQGFWVDVGLLLRARQHVCAARLEEGLPPTWPSGGGERCPPFGGGGGRAPIARWGPVGGRHDPCLCPPLRRDRQTWGSGQRRSCSRGSQAAQGEDPTLNSSSRGTGPSWWCLLSKLEAGGLSKQCRS